MKFRLYKIDDHNAIADWLAQRPGSPLPPHPGLIPKSSSFTVENDSGRPLAVLVCHVCGDAPVASMSWCFAAPQERRPLVHEAVTLAVRGALYCLDRQGVALIWSRLTPHGFRKILSREGFAPSPETDREMFRITQH